MTELRIDRERLWDTMMTIAKIGATAGGGSRRLALTDEDRQARDQFCAWMRESGCAVTIDQMGNVFARRRGRNDAAPPVMVGSHLDTVPTGGRFDGVIGVMAGVELVRTLDDDRVRTEHPIEVVLWTNEEGSRFSPFTLGSMVFAGQVSLDFAHARGEVTRPGSGLTVKDELARTGYLGAAPCATRPVACYFELHNEQGPMLGETGHEVGIVTGSFSARYFVATIRGDAGHVGGAPMDRRRDALVGASRLVLEVNRIGRTYGPDARANAPHLELFPNVRGVIPAEVRLSCDVRHAEVATMHRMEAELRDVATRLAKELGMAIEIEQYYEFGPIRFDDGMLALLRDTARRLGYRWRDILTVAGHDAVSMNSICPTAMLFTPSRADGVSHNEREYSTPEDLAAGTNVLLHAVLAKARVIESR
jgi:beta-ureidopropionase / N-carbamoyl-L-amino-acid hydrolase